MTNLILLVHRDSKPISAYIKVKMWTLTSNWAFLDGLYWDLSELLLQERHRWLFLMWPHSLMCRESYSIQSRSLVFHNLTFLLSMFKSFMVSYEREQKASDVSASHAGPSRLDWWNLEQPPGWIFIASNFYGHFFTAEKVWSKLLQYVADSKSWCAFKILLGQSVERQSTPSMCCGNTVHVGSGSWDAFPRKYHGFLYLRDCWWISRTHSNMTFVMFFWNIYNLQ